MSYKYAWVLFLLPALSQASGAQVEAVYAAESAAVVYLENRIGSVTVRGWDRDSVSIAGTLGAAERIDVRRTADRLIVRAVYPDSWLSRVFRRVRPMRGAELEVRVPRDLELVVNVVAAGASTTGVRGAQRLASVGGDLRVEAFGGEIMLTTVSGDIDVQGDSSSVPVSTAALSGNIELKNIAGAVSATTVTGNVRVMGRLVDLADFQSTSGDIRVEAEVAAGTQLSAATGSGNVTLLVAGDTTGRYVVDTASGNVATCFGTAERRIGRWGERVRLVDGRPGTNVRVSTASGDVALCRSFSG